MNLFQDFRESRARARRMKAIRDFCKEVQAYIAAPGRTFTIGVKNYPASSVRVLVPDNLLATDDRVDHGIDIAWLPCEVDPKASGMPIDATHWLRVKLVDRAITEVNLAEASASSSSEMLVCGATGDGL